jgi:hypothetical protein
MNIITVDIDSPIKNGRREVFLLDTLLAVEIYKKTSREISIWSYLPDDRWVRVCIAEHPNSLELGTYRVMVNIDDRTVSIGSQTSYLMVANY